MRVNMDSSINNEARFKLLAKQVGVPFLHSVGCCWAVWLNCYHSLSERLSVSEANASADVDGFAQAMISVGLADAIGDNMMRIHGVKKRIEFLKRQRKSGSNGGKNRHKSDTHTRLTTEANAKRTLAENNATAQAYSPTPTPTPDLAPSPAPAPVLNSCIGGNGKKILEQEFLESWNSAAIKNGWIQCRTLTGKRGSTFRKRILSAFWRDNWKSAIDRAGPIPGLRGENDRNWKANVEWFLREMTVAKIIEGGYDAWTDQKTDPAEERRRKIEEAMKRQDEKAAEMNGELR